jgi:hypothetical protein
LERAKLNSEQKSKLKSLRLTSEAKLETRLQGAPTLTKLMAAVEKKAASTESDKEGGEEKNQDAGNANRTTQL